MQVLSKQALWSALLTHFREHGCLVEGPLNALKPSLVQLAKPSRAFDSRAFALGGAHSIRFVPVPNADADPARAAMGMAQGANMNGAGRPHRPGARGSHSAGNANGAPPATNGSGSAPGRGQLPGHFGHQLPPAQSPYAIPAGSMPNHGPRANARSRPVTMDDGMSQSQADGGIAYAGGLATQSGFATQQVR